MSDRSATAWPRCRSTAPARTRTGSGRPSRRSTGVDAAQHAVVIGGVVLQPIAGHEEVGEDLGGLDAVVGVALAGVLGRLRGAKSSVVEQLLDPVLVLGQHGQVALDVELVGDAGLAQGRRAAR